MNRYHLGETIVRPQMHVNSFCKTACTCDSTAHPYGNSI